MQAITVLPGQAGSARLDDVPEPFPGEASVLVETLAVGVCGTDLEIANGEYGWAPPGHQRLVLGHESLGRVLQAPEDGLEPGDLVVGIIRQPDPVPCESCAAGEWDMCRSGRYAEHGIKELDGFMRERYRIDPRYAVKLDPEPGPDRGAAGANQRGSQGLGADRPDRQPGGLAAPGGAGHRRRADRAAGRAARGPAGPGGARAGPGHRRSEAELVADLGATYHTGTVADAGPHADVVVECTGSASWCSMPWTRWRPTASCV